VIHTIELSCMLTKSDYDELFGTLVKTRRPDEYKKGVVHVECKTLQDNGIIFEFITNFGEFVGYFLRARVNMKRLIDSENRVALFQLIDYKSVKEGFREKVSRIIDPTKYPFLCDIERWDVRRIDYCIQFKVPDVAQYIKLMQKGNKPIRGLFKIPYSKEMAKDKKIKVDDELRKTHRKGSVYFTSRSMNINFYDKQLEMKSEKNIGRYSDDQINDAENMLRIEVQCLKFKLTHIRRKFHISDKCIKHYLDVEIAKDVLITKYDEIAGKGDYLKKKGILATIEGCKAKRATKVRLVEAVEKANNGTRKTGVWKARLKLERDEGKGAAKKFGERINYLNKVLGVNPIALSENYKLDKLPSLHGDILHYFDDMSKEAIEDELLIEDIAEQGEEEKEEEAEVYSSNMADCPS